MHTYWNPDNARDVHVFVALLLPKKQSIFSSFSSPILSYFMIAAPTIHHHHHMVPGESVVGLVHAEVD